MLNIFRKNLKSEYKERLTKAFPKKLHSDLKEVLKILPFEQNKGKLFGGIFHPVNNLIHETELNLTIENETVTIPYRLYFEEPNPELEKTLTDKQKEILNCIYLRHNNGYLREKRLNLISENYENWTIPFIVQLIGEYIYELLPIIDKKINENTLNLYIEFKNKNPKYWQQTESRVISYWNVYYRNKFPKLNEYLGIKIIERIKKTNAQRRI
jgi:hypothetical protein